MAKPTPPFATQRVVFFALLMGVLGFAAVVAVVIDQNGGKGLAAAPIDALDTVAIVVGSGLAVASLLARRRLHGSASQLAGEAQAAARFRATLVPLALLEGGSLLGLTTWLQNGRPVPGLVVALVLLSLAITIVPFTDPAERRT